MPKNRSEKEWRDIKRRIKEHKEKKKKVKLGKVFDNTVNKLEKTFSGKESTVKKYVENLNKKKRISKIAITFGGILIIVMFVLNYFGVV